MTSKNVPRSSPRAQRAGCPYLVYYYVFLLFLRAFLPPVFPDLLHPRNTVKGGEIA